MGLLASSLVIIFWGWLTYTNKLSLILGTVDNLTSRWKHASLNLVLAHWSTGASIRMHLITWFLDFIALLAFVNTSHALSSCAKESLHAVQIDHSLRSLRTLLLFFLDLVHLPMLLIGLLNTYIVVTKPTLLLVLSVWTLHLGFQSIINTLSLGQWMIHAFWTTDLIHRHIGTHWHALMNLTMSCRWKRISSLLSLSISSTWYISVPMSSTVWPSLLIIARLHHRRQLKLLIVEIVWFLTSVSLSVTRNFLLQINSWWAFLIVVSKWTSFRWHSNVYGVMVVWILLSGGYHMCAHIQAYMLIAAIGISWLAWVIRTLIHKAHWIVHSGMLFARRWMYTAAVQTFVHYFTLMSEFSGIRLLPTNHLLLPIFHILNGVV